MSTPALFSPFSVRGLNLRNRIVISPMAMYAAEEGVANDWHLVHLGKYAIGGVGLILVEATAVESRAGTSPYDVGLWSDRQVEPLRRIVRFTKSQGAATGVQLAHAGRKANLPPPWQPPKGAIFTDRLGEPIAPSPISYLADAPPPIEMTEAHIRDVKAAWVSATKRAAAAEFDLVEIHGAHGYLIHEFLSLQTNKRTDAYGGSCKNRMRLALEITEGVRAAWPEDRPLFFRMSAIDPKDESWTIDDSIVLAKELKSRGVDVIDCSSGGITSRATVVSRRPQGYQVHLARDIRKRADLPTVAVGLITEPSFAEGVVASGEADLVAVGREALYNPHWPLHAAMSLAPERGFDAWPKQYAWWLDRRARSQGLPLGAAD